MPRVCWEEQLCVSCEFVTIRGERIFCGAQAVWMLDPVWLNSKVLVDSVFQPKLDAKIFQLLRL
jgi:hypothetical protein